MLLERMKQNSSIRREFGVHGKITLKFKDGSSKTIFTLESPWDFNQDEKNGIVGLSCVNEGSYQIHLEESPLYNIKLPFLVNPSLNVQLRTKVNAIDRCGHALCHINDIDCFSIYGRYILIGSQLRWRSSGFYEPVEGQIAYQNLMSYLEESGDRELVVKWI